MERSEKLSCDVTFTAQNSADIDIKGKVSVVIDVFRATTSIVAALGSGASRILPVSDVEEARQRKAAMPDSLLCGERMGRPLEGFDMGNSPVAFSSSDLLGSSIILTTTNGTQAIEAAKRSDALLIGALSNVRAVAGAVFSFKKPVVFICAGTEGRFSIEDAYAAGLMVGAIAESGYTLTDAAWAAAIIADTPLRDAITPETCRHYETLLTLGFEEDAEFALRVDTSLVVPHLDTDGWIV